MKDVTGKAGTGKRGLDENGQFFSIKGLPKEVQEEMANNSKRADEVRRHRALGNDRDVHGQKSKVRARELSEENEALKDTVKEQGNLIAELLAKVNTVLEKVAPNKSMGISPIIPKKMTKKQKLQAKAEAIGLDYEEEDTIPELEKNIKEANSF